MFTEERARWLYEHYRWLEANLPPRTHGAFPGLVTPTPDCFPFRHTADHAFALAVFQRVREHLGLLAWPCELHPHLDPDQQHRSSLMAAGVLGSLPGSKGAAGTFSAGDTIEITYAPALLVNPPALIATLAHELCHYLLATVQTEPPGTWSELEPLTDLAAVHEGFGIFLANSAFTFGQWTDNSSQGWQASNQGYLSEAELGFALGVFAVRRQLDPEMIGRHLKANPAEVFWDSLDYVAELDQRPPH